MQIKPNNVDNINEPLNKQAIQLRRSRRNQGLDAINPSKGALILGALKSNSDSSANVSLLQVATKDKVRSRFEQFCMSNP